MARGKEKKAKGGAASGIRLDAHPRARRQISMAKGWGGLAAFAIVLYLSRGAGLPFGDALLRGVLGGIAGYLVGWVIAVTVWRHIALAEIEELRGRLLAKMAADAEAGARAQAEQGDGASATTMVSQT
ncbi:MAG: hypothetical protein JWQ20_1670 [Conexibacter sp.]|jgi:uncharacterized membrane protein YccC|nr:hypothetical protein [Conexibacter sp.]